MSDYCSMGLEALSQEFKNVKAEYEKIKASGLTLDMTRGKPGFDQLDLSEGLLTNVGGDKGYIAMKGTDCRNYGGLDGLDELKELFASIRGINWENVICGGNSSLNMMFDTITQGMVSGFGEGPWISQGKIKFICPAPGYDRHFGICEYYGIEMITVPYLADGPDMDAVEELVKDPAVKGMWCVPKYSNPTGITYSDAVVKRIAALKPAAKDFRVMWDNAYVIHDLYDEGEKLLGIYEECKKNGNEDLVIMFTSTSKISFPGAGIAVEAASDNNLRMLKSRMTVQTIGPNK
ncbi:MAG: aminotransferase class I/II-fold pyridoxal phosphate-dependent enzyme, partial [Clostridia bacterium]|nr:aminotransferase class I/II-fold pyridoxal phosphate-dependent enzyme [Clostridia bacterium]